MRGQRELPGLSGAILRGLREDQPSPHELSRAYLRFARRPQRRSPALLVSCWLVAGLAMGLSIAFAAEAIERQTHRQHTETRKVAVPSAIAKLTANRRATPLPVDAPVDEGPRDVVKERKPGAAGSVVPRRPALDQSASPPGESAAWTKAAEGLRTHDVAQTESALATLEQASNPADREAARLIRAQLMLHQGDVRGAHALLQDLTNSARSSLVRAKARRLLVRIAAPSNSPLNDAPSGT